MKKSLLKVGMLFGSVFVLVACSNVEAPEESTPTEVSTEEVVVVESEDEVEVETEGKILTHQGDFDERGWAVEYTIGVDGEGVIESVNFDYVNEEGDYKTEDEEYISNMEAGSGNNLAETVTYLEEGLIGLNISDLEGDFETVYEEAFGDDYVDVVTGATSTADAFKELTQDLVDEYEGHNN